MNQAQFQMLKGVFRSHCMTSKNDHFNDVQQYCKVFIAQSNTSRKTDQEIFKARGIEDTTVER